MKTLELLEQRVTKLIDLACTLFAADKKDVMTSRCFPNSEIRFSIYYILRSEGNTLYAMEHALGKHHATLIHGISRVDDALKYHADKNLEYIYHRLNDAIQPADQPATIYTNEKAVLNWLKESGIPDCYVNSLVSTMEDLYVY